MRMMAIKDDLYGCWDFLKFLAVGLLLVMCALVLGPYARFEDAFRRRKIQQGKRS